MKADVIVRKEFALQVGQRLAAARVAAGFSQIALAMRLGLPAAGNLSNWENGWAIVPPEYAAKIFLLAKIDANYLYLGDASQLPHSLYEKLFPPAPTLRLLKAETPASEIISRFGGRQAVATMLGLSLKAVMQWEVRSGIPGKWHLRLLREARERNIDLSAADLIREVA